MDNITYFRLNSPYLGDVTKNCALTGAEVDNNFFTLEGRDIKSVELVDNKVTITLLNGKVLQSEPFEDKGVKELDIEFNPETGVLTVTQDGVVSEFGGILTTTNISYPETQVYVDTEVRSDGTLKGKGTREKPCGIAEVHKTGQYRPVLRIIKVNEGQQLPNTDVFVGDRYLTVENVSDCGYLYNYDGLRRLACKLQEADSPWRVPTKEDWDDMLNAVEPNEAARNHSDARSNKWLGEFAGKLLKSRDMWKEEETDGDDTSSSTTTTPDNSLCQEDCNTIFDGFDDPCQFACHANSNDAGIDYFGFGVKGCGYANESLDYTYYKERAYFWTATNHEQRDAYIKVFSYKKSNVLQDIFASDNYLSVRLVKEYDGNNFNEYEDILDGTYSTVLMPSMTKGNRIWTSMNMAVSNCCCTNQNIQPNDGEGLDSRTRYFTNEWNGKEWLRKEVLDGESIVVINHNPDEPDDPFNLDYAEYRVTKDGLIDVAKFIYENVVETISQDIDEINIAIGNLEDKLDEEIERSVAADTQTQEQLAELDTALALEREARIAGDNNLSDALALETQERTTTDNAIISDLNDERQERIAADEVLTQGLATEREERIAADNEFIGSVAVLEEKVESYKAELDEKIEDEEEARIAADEELADKILTADGTVFDSQTGVLTLKSEGGTNDIDVQFSFNLGTF